MSSAGPNVDLKGSGRAFVRTAVRLQCRWAADRRPDLVTAACGLVLFGVALSGRGGFWSLAVPLLLFISTLGFNFSNGFALGLAPFGASAGTASALFGTLQFAIAGIAGAAVSALYDGSARAMAGVMCAGALLAVALYRGLQ